PDDFFNRHGFDVGDQVLKVGHLFAVGYAGADGGGKVGDVGHGIVNNTDHGGAAVGGCTRGNRYRGPVAGQCQRKGLNASGGAVNVAHEVFDDAGIAAGVNSAGHQPLLGVVVNALGKGRRVIAFGWV